MVIPAFSSPKVVGIRSATRGDEKVRAGELLLAAGSLGSEADSSGMRFNAGGAGFKPELDSFSFKRLLQFGYDVLIFGTKQALTGVNDRDAAAKPAEHLAEFEADVSAAEDQQMLGNFLQFHHGDIGEIRNRVNPSERGDARTRPGIDENFLAFESLAVDLDLMGAGKARVPTDEADVLVPRDAFFDGVAEVLNDFVFFGDDGGKIDRNFTGANAPARSIARVVSDLSRSNHCFSGRAAGVDAGAADFGAFDERDFPAQVGERVAERFRGLTRTNGNRVEFHPAPRNNAHNGERQKRDKCTRNSGDGEGA